ncbi:MAG: hypothetical protein BKP49_02945 [Treponema sp. CETP13]|nr:MAG: hypothetical protein BKP49_02945 [Treponema sp. CETP13]
MSTCPSHDVHSMYIDNELPEPFKRNFEKHLLECLDCSTVMQQLKTVHDDLQEDSKNIVFSEEDLSASYERLQTKMRFASVTAVADNKSAKFSKTLWRTIPLVAAALVVAIVLPLRFFSDNTNYVTDSIPSLQSQQNIIQASLVENKGVIASDDLSHFSIDFSSMDLTSMDFFRPEFTSDGQMKISITLTGVANLPISKGDNIIDLNGFDSINTEGSNFIESTNLIPVEWNMDTNN